MSKTVLSITVNEIVNDNRVINYTNTLAKNGYSTYLFSPHTNEAEQKVYDFQSVYFKLFSQQLPSFIVFSYLKLFEYTIRAYKKSKLYNPDIIHAHDLKGLLIACIIKKYFKNEIKLVYDAHEYETEVNGLNGFHKKIYKLIEQSLMKYVTRMITVSNRIADEYVRLYGIERPVVLLNVPNVTFNSNYHFDLFRKKFKIKADQRIFLYQGYLTRGRGIEIILESFNRLSDDKNVIVFMGKGSLSGLIQSYQNNGRVFFHEFVNPHDYLNFTASADVGVAFIEDISLSDRYCLPNKLFEYIFSGLPIICSNLPEMKWFVEKNGVGIVASENTIEGFMIAIKSLNDKGLKCFKENIPKTYAKYCWAHQEENLLKLYQSI